MRNSASGNPSPTVRYALDRPDPDLVREIENDPAVRRAAVNFRAAATECLDRLDAEGVEIALRLAASHGALVAAVGDVATARAIDQARSAQPPPPQRIELSLSLAGAPLIAVNNVDLPAPVGIDVLYDGEKVVGTKPRKAP